MTNTILDKILRDALVEDIGNGDHSTLATIPLQASAKAVLLAKEKGVLAGIRVIQRLFEIFDPTLSTQIFLRDGDKIQPGDQILTVSGYSRSLLQVERLALNIVQRMSGIATLTSKYVEQTKGTKTVILDTRKTSPNLRVLEKEAVRIGGGQNHRMGLFDMIMLKDNHIDYAGGIKLAIRRSNEYRTEHKLQLPIEIEVRDFSELTEVLSEGGIDRIMLDNFSPADTSRAVKLVAGQYEMESSGGISLDTVRQYALTGVDYISVGALTHQIQSLDLSLKALL